jgi:hypothetical protein
VKPLRLFPVTVPHRAGERGTVETARNAPFPGNSGEQSGNSQKTHLEEDPHGESRSRNAAESDRARNGVPPPVPPPVLLVRARRVRGAWILTGRCPYCRMRHQHGGGSGPTPNLGLRVAHCTYPHRCATNGSYRLELEAA